MKLLHAPYPTRRKPTLAGNGVVATSQPLAAQAGLDILRRGGNAIDAAVAAAATLTVVEPTSNGIGGDLFALVWDGNELHGLNASGRAGAAASPERLRAKGAISMPELGWDSVTVPGGPNGWSMLMERFGSMSLADVLAPGATYAQEGYPVSPTVSQLWAVAAKRYLAQSGPEFAGWREVFAPGGTAPAAGERWSSPAHAATLRRLGEVGTEDFYTGKIAEQILAYSKATGGSLTADDFAAHKGEWVQPISTNYRGYDVWEIPPSGQGIAALMTLKMLEEYDLAGMGQVSAESWHLQMEAMKVAFVDAHRYVADPSVVAVPTQTLLSPEYIASRRAEIGDAAKIHTPGVLPKGGTVYLCTADRDGRMVSLIQSNYQGFGSGIVVPEAGIALHNRALGFTLEQGHPNEFAAGKRPFHTIIPGFVTRGAQALGPFGVMGAPMQPQGHAQVIIGTVDHGLNPQAALDAPRWRVLEGLDAVVELETPHDVYRGLVARGHRLLEPSETYAFGRGQIIWRLDDGVYVAGSEPRADGCVAAY
jgi:gamma-glutamyltranspeptidase/glutathione hydrolase